MIKLMDTKTALRRAKLLAYQQIADRASVDLYFLCSQILGYDIIEPFAHGPLCAATRPLLFWKNKDEAKKHVFPTDFGRSEEDGMPDEAELEEFYKRTEKFIPGDTYSVKDKQEMSLHELMALMPRGTLKSSCVTIGFTIQFLLNHRDARVLIDSETFTKATAFIKEIKGHLEGNEVLREIWMAKWGVYPDQNKRSNTWSDSSLVLAHRVTSKKEPSIEASGIDVTKNGMHYDLIIFDDLHSEVNTQTKDQIDKAINHFKLAYSLLDPDCPVVVIGTRWTYTDLYQYIIDERADSFNFITRAAKSSDGELLYPGRLTIAFLEKQRKGQGSYIFSCNPGDAPILMADWSIKRIDEVKVGDEVIGFELGSGKNKNKLVKTTVTETNHRLAMTQKVTLDNGRQIRCTPDHQWYTGRNDKTHKPYKPVSVGSKMLQVLNTDDNLPKEKFAEYGYLAGMIDGEGAAKHGSINISQSELHHSQVCQRIRDTLESVGLPYKTGKDYTVINGGKQAKFDILRYGNPAKADQIRGTLWKRPGMAASSKPRVVDILPHKEEVVYALTTGTGNYVAWGMMSKNCQYMNNPVDEETAKFKREWFKYKNLADIDGVPINWYLTIDPSFEGDTSDYAAFVISGMDYQNQLYVRHILKVKRTYGQIVMLTFELYRRFQPKMIIVETLATQKSLEYSYKEKQREMGSWLPIRYVNSRQRSKEERIVALSPKYEFGEVYHIRECNQIEELEDELIHFPKAKNDDVSDAFATVLEYATPPMRGRVRTEKDEKRRARLKKLSAPRSPMIGY